jgi:hypothetical protein
MYNVLSEEHAVCKNSGSSCRENFDETGKSSLYIGGPETEYWMSVYLWANILEKGVCTFFTDA